MSRETNSRVLDPTFILARAHRLSVTSTPHHRLLLDLTADNTIMASTDSYPPGGTFLDTLKKSFSDVPVDMEKNNAIATTEFLEAAESLTTLFGNSYLSFIFAPVY